LQASLTESEDAVAWPLFVTLALKTSDEPGVDDPPVVSESASTGTASIVPARRVSYDRVIVIGRFPSGTILKGGDLVTQHEVVAQHAASRGRAVCSSD
jgi:hypothetical protein